MVRYLSEARCTEIAPKYRFARSGAVETKLELAKGGPGGPFCDRIVRVVMLHVGFSWSAPAFRLGKISPAALKSPPHKD